MPTLTDGDDIGAISGSGFAFGYLGGLVALILMLVFFAENATTGKTLIGADPLFGLDAAAREGTRAVGPFTAIWYVVFMLPFLLWVKEPKAPKGGIKIGAALREVKTLVLSLGKRRSFASYLLSSLCYRDALNALYAFGGVYASNVLGWSITQIGVFGILGGITAMASSWVCGKIDMRAGPKPVLAWSVVVLIVVCLIIVGMDRTGVWGLPLDPQSAVPDIIFYICGATIGAAGGPLQASSRTMLLRHTRADRAAEAFGLFALSGKVASFISPLLVGIVSHLSDSARIGISPVILLFVIGLVLLRGVSPNGERPA
jgi:UMF1 family MFS transporter